MSAVEQTLRDALRELVREELEVVREELREELRASAESPRKWLTLAEAAAELGCSKNAVRMRANRGRLETRKHGRSVYVSAASLDRLG